MSFDVPTKVDPNEIIQAGMSDRVSRLHGVVRGKVATIVTPAGGMTYIRVFPTSNPNWFKLPGSKDVVWATVCWDYHTEEWHCLLHNLPGSTKMLWDQTNHKTLGGALRRARKSVQENAGEPSPEWSKTLSKFSNPGPYPSDHEIAIAHKYSADYFRSVEAERLDDESDVLFDDDSDDQYIPYY